SYHPVDIVDKSRRKHKAKNEQLGCPFRLLFRVIDAFGIEHNNSVIEYHINMYIYDLTQHTNLQNIARRTDVPFAFVNKRCIPHVDTPCTAVNLCSEFKSIMSTMQCISEPNNCSKYLD